MSANRHWRRSIAAAIAVALFASNASAQRSSPDLPSWAKDLDRDLAIVQSTHGDHVHEDDPWLVLYNEVLIESVGEGHFTQKHRKAWQNISAEKRPLRVGVPFDSATEALTGFTLLKQRGKLWTKYTGKHTGVEVPELSSDFVTADRVNVLETSEVRPGERVFGTWTVNSTETFPGDRILPVMDPMPVNRLVVRAPTPVVLRAFGRFGAVDRNSYELNRIPAFGRAHDASDRWRASPLMSIPFLLASMHAADSSWRDSARRARALFDAALAEDRAASDIPAHVRKAKELTTGLTSIEQKVAALVTFAQSLVYRNIEWGIGAYKPEPPSEVLRTMSGDCKAKVLLLSAMLAEIGIESVPVLARLGEPYLEYQGPATTNIFNHMVLAVRTQGSFGERARLESGVGRGWVLFDPTDPLATFGLPPRGLQGTLALWLHEDGDRFDIEFAEVADRFRVDLDFEVRETNTALFRMTIDGASPYASAAKHNSDPDGLVPRLKRYAEESLRYGVPGLKLDDVLYDAPDHLNGQAAKVTLIGSVPHPAQKLSSELVAIGAPTALVAHAIGLPRQLSRKTPPDRERALMEEWETPVCCAADQSWWEARIDVELPQRWHLEFQPQVAKLDNPWITAGIDNEDRAWHFNIRRMRGHFPGSAPAQRVADLNTILSAMQHAFVARVDER